MADLSVSTRRLGDADASATTGDLERVDAALIHRRDEPAEEVQIRDGLGCGAGAFLLHSATPLRLALLLVGTIHRFARSRYLSSRRSTRTTSPSFRNRGTCTTAPVSSFAGLVPPCA